MTDNQNQKSDLILTEIKGQLEGIHKMLKTIKYIAIFWTVLGVISLGFALFNMIFLFVSQVPRLF